jgi:8-oxo-dGTP diphosphatase
MAHPFTIGSFAIIFDTKKRVLLCHRRDMDMWNLPGGGMERGELPTETAIRETLEETGLRIAVLDLVGVYGKPDADDLVFAFLGKVTGGEISPTDEADEIKYFKVRDIPANTSPRQVERIHDALKPKGFPHIRHQNAPSSRMWLQLLKKKEGKNGKKRAG